MQRACQNSGRRQVACCAGDTTFFRRVILFHFAVRDDTELSRVWNAALPCRRRLREGALSSPEKHSVAAIAELAVAAQACFSTVTVSRRGVAFLTHSPHDGWEARMTNATRGWQSPPLDDFPAPEAGGAPGRAPLADTRGACGRGSADAAQYPLRAPDCRHQRVGAHPGADRLGQGGVRACHAPRQRARRTAVHRGELRRHPGDSDRERALRVQARRVHWSAARGPARQDRAVLGRDALPRRDRRHAARLAEPAAARARGARGRAARQRERHRRGSARAGGVASQPARDDRARRIPRGSLLPAQRHHARAAGACASERTRSD